MKPKTKVVIGVIITFLAIAGIITGVVVGNLPGDVEEVAQGEQDSVQQDCSGVPREFTQSIATNCSVNTGTCSSEVCNTNEDQCCRPVFEETTTDCAGETIPYTKVKECKCQACSGLEISISGRISDGYCTMPHCNFSIQINGSWVTTANTYGLYNFVMPYPTTDRAVFSVVGDGIFDQPMVVNVASGRQIYANVEVKVTRKPEPILFRADEGLNVSQGQGKSFSMEFLPNSTLTADGNPYNGTVSLTMDFLDPSNNSDYDRIPGQLVVDIGGENTTGFLSSAGMFRVELNGEDGSPLSANNVGLVLQANDMSANESSAQQIWFLNDTTGMWQVLDNKLQADTNDTDDMTNTTGGRSKRQAFGSPRRLSARMNFNWRFRRIYNLDALLSRYCYMKVRIFDDDLSKDNQIPYVSIISLYKRPSGAWVNFLRAVSYRERGACIQVPCDGLGFTNIYTVNVRAPYFRVYSPNVGEDHQDLIDYRPTGDDSFDIRIPLWGFGPAIYSGNGPFYWSWWQCYYSNFEDEQYFRFLRKFPATTTEAPATTSTNVTTTSSDSQTTTTLSEDATTTPTDVSEIPQNNQTTTKTTTTTVSPDETTKPTNVPTIPPNTQTTTTPSTDTTAKPTNVPTIPPNTETTTTLSSDTTTAPTVFPTTEVHEYTTTNAGIETTGSGGGEEQTTV